MPRFERDNPPLPFVFLLSLRRSVTWTRSALDVPASPHSLRHRRWLKWDRRVNAGAIAWLCTITSLIYLRPIHELVLSRSFGLFRVRSTCFAFVRPVNVDRM